MSCSTSRAATVGMALGGSKLPATTSKTAKLMNLLEEGAKLRRDIQDFRGQFLSALEKRNLHQLSPASSPRRATQSPSRGPLTPRRVLLNHPLSSSPRVSSPAMRVIARRRGLLDAPARRRPTVLQCDLSDKENRTPTSCVDPMKDLSTISDITQQIGYREQPSTAEICGEFHSTFNYPLHSTLNYPLSSTLNFHEEPILKLDEDNIGESNSQEDSSTLVSSRNKSTRLSPSGRESYSLRRHRSLKKKAEKMSQCGRRCEASDDEVDVDCDSSVLSEDLEDTIVSPTQHNRILRRQAGQAVLTLNPRPPIALSQSDFFTKDDLTCLESSTLVTRGSPVGLADLTTTDNPHLLRSSCHKLRVSRRTRPDGLDSQSPVPTHENFSRSKSRKPSGASISSKTSHRRKSTSRRESLLGLRLPPCGEDAKENSDPCQSMVSASLSRRSLSSVSSYSNVHELSREQKKVLVKKLRHFTSDMKSPSLKSNIITLDVL